MKKLTSFQCEILDNIARGYRPQSRNASRAINTLFRLGLLTDVDPVDNRRAIGGKYLTDAGRAVLQVSEGSVKP